MPHWDDNFASADPWYEQLPREPVASPLEALVASDGGWGPAATPSEAAADPYEFASL